MKILPRFLRIGNGPSSHTYAATTLNAVPITTSLQLPKSDSDWQQKGWAYYEVVPEMRQVVDHRANAVSKVVINVAKLGEDGKPEVVNTPQTRAFLDWLFGGRAHHSTHMALLAQQSTVVGESYIVIAKDDNKDGKSSETWYTLAPDLIDTSKMGGKAGYVEITSPTTGAKKRYPIDNTNPDNNKIRIIRLWKTHPHNQWEADSPTRGAISTLDTIAHLNASIRSAALSRLIGGGIYPMPLEANLPKPTEQDGDITSYDKFKNDLQKAASASITNPASAEAQLPILVHIPAEAIKSMLEKPIDFSTKFDERVGELLDKQIYRYAQGQPIPTEKMIGNTAGNRWSAWHFSEEDLKMDIGPLTELFLSALTVQILHPLLGEELFLYPDYTALVTRPDRTPEAIQLYEAEIITLAEARDLSGFPETSDGELKKREVNQPASTRTVNQGKRQLPQRQGIRDGNTYAALVTNNLLVNELLRETGKRMFSGAPRSQRASMMNTPEEERHLTYSGAFAAFQEVVPKVVERYADVLTADQISSGVLAAQSAITEKHPVVSHG
jgi:hypothetical protein